MQAELFLQELPEFQLGKEVGVLVGVLGDNCVWGLLEEGELVGHEFEGVGEVFALVALLDEVGDELVVCE